jgi:hypothetical protein
MTIIPWSVIFKNHIILVTSSIPWYNWWGQPGLRDIQEKCQKLGSQYMVTMWPVVIKQFQLATNFYLDIQDWLFQFLQSYMVICGTEKMVNHIKKVMINTISQSSTISLSIWSLSSSTILYLAFVCFGARVQQEEMKCPAKSYKIPVSLFMATKLFFWLWDSQNCFNTWSGRNLGDMFSLSKYAFNLWQT